MSKCSVCNEWKRTMYKTERNLHSSSNKCVCVCVCVCVRAEIVAVGLGVS